MHRKIYIILYVCFIIFIFYKTYVNDISYNKKINDNKIESSELAEHLKNIDTLKIDLEKLPARIEQINDSASRLNNVIYINNVTLQIVDKAKNK